MHCLLYTSDAADDLLCVDLGGRRIIKKKKKKRRKKKNKKKTTQPKAAKRYNDEYNETNMNATTQDRHTTYENTN